MPIKAQPVPFACERFDMRYCTRDGHLWMCSVVWIIAFVRASVKYDMI